MQRLRGSVAILVLNALLMTVAIPDVDHHLNLSAASQVVSVVCDAHGTTNTPDNSGDNKHHCLVCPSSSQKMSPPAQDVPGAGRVLFSIASIPPTEPQIQIVDFHYSGKRSPPLS